MPLVEESVWDYPRPPALEQISDRITVKFAGREIVSTTGAFRVLETSHPPTYYIPPDDVLDGVLKPIVRRTMCEWKGAATYFDVVVDGKSASAAAWCYPTPTKAFEPIRDFISVYPGAMDECAVAGEVVRKQDGDFYGGWITSNLKGPFKGPAGTQFW
ncbi:MAG: DUF427 domain-containing protein [Pseudomonadota bacterium]